MDINKLLIELLAGAFTGYTTNSLAVKMLFKNYGPFGGVIIKTREEFIENISQLVERDIINEKTLEESLNNEEFKESIRQSLEYFFAESLNTHSNFVIKDIPKFNRSLDNSFYFFKENSQIYYQKAAGIILSEFCTKELLSKKQFNYITQQFFDELSSIFINTPKYKDFLKELMANVNKKNLNTLLPPKSIEIMSNNYKAILDKPAFLRNDLKFLLANIKKLLKLDQLSGQLIQEIKKKRLQDLKIDEDYFYKLRDNLINTTNSKNGQRIIRNFFKKLLDSISKENLSIATFFDDRQENDINEIVQAKLEKEINLANQWIDFNHRKIDYIFDQIFYKTLKQESRRSPWKTAIKKSAYKLYRQNSNTTPNSIISTSLKNIKYSKNKNKLKGYINRYLSSIELKHILVYANSNLHQDKNTEKDKFLSKTNFFSLENISNAFNKTLNKYLNSLDLNIFSEDTIGEIINLDIFDRKNLIGIINKNQELEKYLLGLFSPNVDEIIESIFHNKISLLSNPEEKDIYYEKLINIFSKNKGLLKFQLENKIYKNIEDKPLAELINEQSLNSGLSSFNEYIYNNIHNKYKEKENYNLNTLISNFTKNEKNISNFSELLIKQINLNLPSLLKGNISGIIRNNLQSISDNDVKEIIEDFIGQELKPITYFGALLGIITALLLYLLQTNTVQITESQLPLSLLVYGFIGYITNVIAIKMIFRPYNKKKILGIPLPFTPGVVSKEKGKFANSVGNFIDKELLNQTTVKTIINKKREIIHNIFRKKIIENDYQFLLELIRENRSEISISLLNYLKKEKNNLIDYLIKIIKKPEFLENKQKLLNSISENLGEGIEYHIQKNIGNLSIYLYNIIKEADDISSLIPEFLKENINKSIEEIVEDKTDYYIESLRKNQEEGKIENILADLIDNFYYKYQNKKLEDIPEEFQKKIGRFLYNFSKKILINNSEAIKKMSNSVITQSGEKFLANTPKLVKENKNQLKKLIIKEAKSKIGYWAKAGKIVGFEETLESFADLFIDEGIPEILDLFLKERSDSILEEFLLNDSELIKILTGIFDNQQFRETIEENIFFLLKELSVVSLSDLFAFLKIEKASDILKHFSREIIFLSNELLENLKNNKDKLKKELNNFSSEILEEYFYSKNVDRVLKNIDENIIEKTIRHIYEELNLGDFISRFFSHITKDIISNNISDNKLINVNYLEKDLNNIYDSFFTNPTMLKQLKFLLSDIISDITYKIPKIIDKETAEYLLDLLITAIIDTMEIFLPELIKQINIKNITVKEINNMNPEEIEKLFYSFAGKYFGKLEKYGLLGGIIGILSELIKTSI